MTSEIMLDDENQLIPSLLQQLVYEPNISIRLQALDTLLNAIDDNISEAMNVKLFREKMREKYLNRIDFVKQLKLYSKINDNIETGIEYYGQDFLTHPEYIFSEQFEKEVVNLTKAINTFVGKLLKEYSKGESIEL